jgi:hypothetical protein
MKKEHRHQGTEKNQPLSKTKTEKIEKSFRAEIAKEAQSYLSHELKKYKDLSIHVAAKK